MRCLPFMFILLTFACSTVKKNSTPTAEAIDALEIGKDQTALFGTVTQLGQDGESMVIMLSVRAARQGGTSAPAIAVNSSVSATCTEIFLRAYKDRTGKELLEEVTIGNEVILLVKQTMKQNTLTVYDIKTTAL